MRKFLNKLTCMALSLTFLMGCMATPAFAYSGEENGEEVKTPSVFETEEEPVTVTEQNVGPLTPEGNLTVVDDYQTTFSDGTAQQFITLVSKSGAYFYLIIDRAADGDQTAHFLNMVDEADLLALMDHLQIAKAHLLGFSDGGNLALTFALAHPERVQSLILNGANLEPGGVKLSTQLPIVLGYGCCRLLSPFSHKARQNGAVLGLMVNHPHIPSQALAALTMPALVIVGERDMIRDRHSQLIARSLPNAQFVRIPGGDHFCAAKCPEVFNHAVLSFLQNLPA